MASIGQVYQGTHILVKKKSQGIHIQVELSIQLLFWLIQELAQA